MEGRGQGELGRGMKKIVGGRVQRGDGGRKREGGKQVGWINGCIKREMDGAVDGLRFMNRNNVWTDG